MVVPQAFTQPVYVTVTKAIGYAEPSAVELGNVRFLRLEAARKNYIIRSPDPNDVGTHTGCRSGEVRRITTQVRRSISRIISITHKRL